MTEQFEAVRIKFWAADANPLPRQGSIIQNQFGDRYFVASANRKSREVMLIDMRAIAAARAEVEQVEAEMWAADALAVRAARRQAGA